MLGNDYVFDDTAAIVDNPLVTGERPASDAFTVNFWGGRAGYEHVTTFRPLTTLGFRASFAISRGPTFQHAVNLLLHGLTVAAVFALVFAWFSSLSAAAIAAALFAVHPVHVEAIAGAVNRAELQTALFYVLALYGLVRRRYGLTLVLFALAMFSKEHAVTWPVAAAIVVGHQTLRQRRQPNRFPKPALPPSWLWAGVGATIAGYLTLRGYALPALLGGDIPPSDNPIVAYGLGPRLLTACRIYFEYVCLLIAPANLSADYSAMAIPVSVGMDAEVFAGVGLVAAGLGALVVSYRRSLDAWALLLLFAVLYGLLSNFLVLNTIIMAERLLYLPSVAFCALIGIAGAGALTRATTPTLQVVIIAAMSLVVVGFATRSAVRSTEWRDAQVLFASSAKARPGSARAYHNLGHALMTRGALDQAEAAFKDALVVAPDDPDVLNSYGTLQWERGLYVQARDKFRASLAERASKRPLANLCRALVATGDHAEAAPICANAANVLPGDAMVLYFLGVALAQTGDDSGAITALQAALKIEPDNPHTRLELERLTARE